MAKIQIVVRNQSGCDYFRVLLPFSHLQKNTEWSTKNTIEMLWIGQDEWRIDCDILIYNKCIATPVQVLKEYQSQGMKIVVDIDDYWILPPGHANFEWNNSGNDKLTLEHIKMADLIVCTSLRLQDRVREYNKNTVVIPNALPFGSGNFKAGSTIEREKMSFLYACGVAHLPDVELLEGKFRRIGSDQYIKDRAEFVLAGYEKAKQKRYRSQKDMIEQNSNFRIEDAVGPFDHMKNIFSYTDSYKVIPTAPVTEYINCYDHADVGIVPLRGTQWDSYKSELKLLECTTRDIPAICSSVAPYSDLRPIEGVMWVEKPDDWINYIRKCIKDPQWVKEQGQKMGEAIRDLFHLDRWNKTRAEVLGTLKS